ncbi:dihydroxyacetone kinase subunit M [Serratia fonticola]|uniref:Dihydroxyacetone kinase subunit M n=1 Tax=Serratia fonticola TaxID=47917 RepID=A0A4U9W6T3_SERFO|nr:dihydroxyacetone kinase subunit M [Serratia fonticola]
MINIVVVSHSAQLAQGVEQLARQMMRARGANWCCGGGR